jgi:hypothetical protein
LTLRYDLRINQGETFRVSIPVLDEDGDPVSLSGMTAVAQARDLAADALLHEWTVVNSGIAFDAHKVVLKVPAATSSAWTWRDARYALELTDGSSNVTRLVEGYVIVHPEVVRP